MGHCRDLSKWVIGVGVGNLSGSQRGRYIPLSIIQVSIISGLLLGIFHRFLGEIAVDSLICFPVGIACFFFAVLVVLVHCLCIFVEVGVVQVVCDVPGYEGGAFCSGYYDRSHFIGS